MRKSKFVRIAALAVASCAVAVALTGCTKEEVIEFLISPKGSSSSSQELKEIEYKEITPEIQAQIDALYAQLEALQSAAETEVTAAAASAEAAARAEWATIPANERTTLRKYQVIMNHTSALSSIQSKYDSQVKSIVNEMRSILTSNGCDPSQANEAWLEYQSAKSAMIASLRSEAGV